MHREVRLARRPEGLPETRHLTVAAAPIPVAGPGEVLARNLYFRVDASIRMVSGAGAEASPDAPFPPIAEGAPLAGEALGEVVAAGPGADLAPGDLVLHRAGWREYACVPAAACLKVADDLADRAAHLSHGWTAYAALTRGAAVPQGGTVFVSSAAGAIGSMAGRIARLLGAGRVIGATSSPAKARRLVDELGYDVGLAREAGPLIAQLAVAAPDGIDLWLDLVGGDQFSAAVDSVRPGGRILVLGALSGQLAASGTGRTAPAMIDSFPLLLKRLSIRGYSADDDPEARAEWTRRFGEWLERGEIGFPHVVVEGIEQAPAALEAASRGRHFGVVLVRP